MRKIKIIVIM